MKRTRMNLKICLFILPLTVACTDIGLEESTGSMPDSGKFNADPVVSIRAEQSPDNVVSMTFTYGDSETSAAKDIFLRTDKPAESNLSVTLTSAGEDFVSEYSESTGIDYTLLPAAFWRLSGGNMISMAVGSSESAVNTLTIFAVNTLGNVLEPGRYLLPLVASSLTQAISDGTILIDVDIRESYTDPDGYEVYTGEDMFTVFYLNTSEYDPRLANDMILQIRESNEYSYRGLGNIVNLRTSSVDYDENTGKVSVLPSADMRYILEHWTERGLPVQETGRKVCLCIEGGGKGIGFCNFTDTQIEDFVSSAKRLVDTYGLDGINLWDRNTGYDKAVENGFPEMNRTSYPKLIKALKEVLGEDKLLTLTDYEEPTEYFHDTESMGGIAPGDYLDYVWSGYCSESEPVQIVDPWHQGMSPVSELHPRQPMAGLDAKYYGCIHATWYTGEETAQGEKITDWIQAGYRQSGISVFYDIHSIRQDKFEGSVWAWPSYVLGLLANDTDIQIQINMGRLLNPIGPDNPGGNQYNKWVKDW